MKNILIFGPSRAGKTSLAKRLKDEFQYNVLNEDNLVVAFERAFPQLGINCGENYEETAVNITPFVVHYLCDLAQHSHYISHGKFVADMTFFQFDKGLPLLKETLREYYELELLDVFTFIFLDNGKTSEELFADIRKHDTQDDWTYYITDDELRKHCDENVGIDWDFYEKWKELDIKRYDVSEGRERIFDRIVEDIRSK
jgi:GTPase SAR1 family protein